MEYNLEELLAKAPELVMSYGFKLTMAIVIFIVGKWLANTLANSLGKAMSIKHIDATVAIFTRNITYYALLTIVVVAALGQLGLQTASFVAVLGAAGLAVGFALQGSLANFAAGILLILFRPFKSGDLIETAGVTGVVQEISIFSTILTTGDNKRIVIPNNAIMSGTIINFSTIPTRRVDIPVNVSYQADLALVRQTLTELAAEEERVLKNQDITIGVAALADSSINFTYRVWVNSDDYWGVFFALNEKIKLRFDQVGIEIPHPQMDVHLNK